MAGGEDDTSGSLFANDGELGGRGCGQTDVHYTVAHGTERGADQRIHHCTADACIAAYNQCVVFWKSLTALRGVGRAETNYIYGIESLAYATTYRAANAGNTFY